MKRRYVIIWMLLLIIGCAGCSRGNINAIDFEKVDDNSDKADCYLLSSSNPEFGGSVGNSLLLADENKWWNGLSYISDRAPKQAEVDFCGITYKGSYGNSRYESYNSFATDYYEGDDGLIFGLNADNGYLVYLNLKTLSFFEDEPTREEVEDVKSQGVEFASKYASEFIDVKEYELLEPNVVPYQPDESKSPTMTFYTYTFVKKINGEYSSSYISVQITSKGNLASIVVGDIWAFSGSLEQSIEKYKDINLDEVVIATLEELSRDKEAPSFQIERKYYALTPSGEAVMCVRATCRYRGLMGETENDSFEEVGLELIVK